MEWVLRRRALDEVESRLRGYSPRRLALLRQARVAHEGAVRLLEPLEPLHNGDGAPLALGLLREAAWLALGALGERVPGASLLDLLEGVPRETLVRVAGGEEALASAVEGWLGVEPAALMALPAEVRGGLAREARGLVERLLAELGEAERTRELLLRQRWVRLLAAGVVLAALLGLGWWAQRRLRLPPDLAEGRPWSTSSAYGGFNPVKHVCDGNRTQILFHTNQDASPWFEVDLGASAAVGFVEVRNRGDMERDRAVPLVIEVSEDRQKWVEVARREDSFLTWSASFPMRSARYVRARVLRKSFLHLEKLTVRKRG